MVTPLHHPRSHLLNKPVGLLRDAGVVEGMYRRMEGPFAGLKEKVCLCCLIANKYKIFRSYLEETPPCRKKTFQLS